MRRWSRKSIRPAPILRILLALRVWFWPIATNFTLGPDCQLSGESGTGPGGRAAAPVENDPLRTSRRVLICTATNVGDEALDHLVCDGEQRRQHVADCLRRVAGYDPQAPYGCFTGPISGVRTGLANPKKITTP